MRILLKISLFSLLTLSYVSFLSQNFVPVEAINYGGRVDDVFFLDSLNGYWCTGSGQILKTTDGLTASVIYQAGGYLRSIEFLDENVGFAGTLDNLMYRTTDAGNTWTPLVIEHFIPGICGMHAINNQTLFASGAWFEPAYIIKTTDAGDTWTYQDMSEQAQALVDIHFIDENIGFVTGYNTAGSLILKTIDGGETWAEVYNNNVPGSYVWKIDDLFNNNQFIYAAIELFNQVDSGGNMVKSLDQGETWIEVTTPGYNMQAIGFTTELHGWIGGHVSLLLETFDGGETWNETGQISNSNRIFILDQDNIFVSGDGLSRNILDSSIKVNEIPYTKKTPKTTIYPNPINKTINYSIEIEKQDNLIIFLADSKGQKIKSLKRAQVSTGTINYTFNIDLPDGNYMLISHLNGSYAMDKILVINKK